MFCIRCGKQITNADARFCHKCGNRIEMNTSAIENGMATQVESVTDPRTIVNKGSVFRKRYIYGSLSALIIIIGIIYHITMPKVANFESLLMQARANEAVGLLESKTFLDKNIAYLSKEDAAIIVLEYEKIQIQRLSSLNQQWSNVIYQKEIGQLGKEKLKDPNNVKNPELKAILIKAYENGYTLAQSEGQIYHIINYQKYLQYRSYVTTDIGEYIDMMVQAQERPTVADAGIMIGWDELLERTIQTESFINRFPNSKKINEMGKKYNSYVDFVLYGLENTPIFNRSTRTLNPKTKLGYETVVAKGGNEKIVKKVQGLLELLRNKNYQLTGDVDLYRKNARSELKVAQTSN